MNNVKKLEVKISNKFDEFCILSGCANECIRTNVDWRDFRKALRLLYNAQCMFNGYKGSYFEYLKLEYNDWSIKIQDTKDVTAMMKDNGIESIDDLMKNFNSNILLDGLDFN